MGMEDMKKGVLIVEDDPMIALDLEMAFEDAGFTVLSPAHDVMTAMEILRDQTVGCACLDFNLGSETSVPIAEALQNAGIPFVVSTGMAERARDALHSIPCPIVSKPTNPAALIGALAS